MREDVLASAILNRLRREMNGAVVGAMEQRGIVYNLNYGVSIPTIRSVALGYAPDHDLALVMFSSGVRELMIAALYIADPHRVTSEQMQLWSRSFTNPEIVENTVAVLFCRAPQALNMARSWLASDQMYLCYAAMLMLAKLLKLNSDIDHGILHEIITEGAKVTSRDDFSITLASALAGMMSGCAVCSEELRKEVASISQGYGVAQSRLVQYTGEEIKWRIEI